MPNITSKIDFHEFPIPNSYGTKIFKIYAVVENSRSEVMENFNRLNLSEKELIKDLICKMATCENFKSPKIKYNLHGFNFGEIIPRPHRFFFFQKCGNNYIFFGYTLKNQNSLGNNFYKQLDLKKAFYEQEFEKFSKRI